MSNPTILDGKIVAQKIKNEVAEELKTLYGQFMKDTHDDLAKLILPDLTVIIVGDDPASQVYVNNKEKACKEVGLMSTIIRKHVDITEKELIELIQELNEDPGTAGILVQLPLPKHIDQNRIINAISPIKDVDGFHPVNMGRLVVGQPGFIPCTPAGIMKMLEYYEIDPAGKRAVVIGRSNIVGKPISQLLLQANATIIQCHSRTPRIDELTYLADIIVVATGKPKTLYDGMVGNYSAIIVDVGINRINGKLCGDVDFEQLYDFLDEDGYITPVPGGVGPLTIAMLLSNTVKAIKWQKYGGYDL
jgi:methylenetetrahydrofolate dehydrogenase (NADP+)/methenyltetrahydrofolate cyclohydrolase